MNNSEENLLNKIVYLMQTDDSTDAPQDSVKWAKNLFRSRLVAPKKSLVERIFAVLQVNLAPNKAVFGERSASASQARQMFFDAGDAGIDLRIAQTETGFSLRGQILGGNFANAAVKLGEFETKANELSEFSFDAVAGGNYSLILLTGEIEVVIENLELK